MSDELDKQAANYNYTLALWQEGKYNEVCAQRLS